MGDRCTLTIRKADQPRFEELLRQSRLLGPEDSWRSFFDEVEEEETSEVLHGTVHEANCGLSDERHGWAQAGLEFSGHHGEGGTYPAALFVAVDGELLEVAALDGDPIVPVDGRAILRRRRCTTSDVTCAPRPHSRGAGMTRAWKKIPPPSPVHSSLARTRRQ